MLKVCYTGHWTTGEICQLYFWRWWFAAST